MMKLNNNLKILIWNTEWAKPHSKRERIIKEIVKTISPDIICITEGYIQSWQDFGYTISSNEDYGYKIHQGRRKVILISKTPWDNIDEIGDINMPNGRIDFDNIKLESINATEANVIKSYIGSVDLLKVKGTQHQKYKNKSWSELLELLGKKSHRATSNLRHLTDNPDYYLSKEEKDTWSFYKKNDNYYINEGNHRTIFARYFFYLNNIEPIIYGVTIKEVALS